MCIGSKSINFQKMSTFDAEDVEMVVEDKEEEKRKPDFIVRIVPGSSAKTYPADLQTPSCISYSRSS